MKRISLVFLSLLVIVFISGCTQTSNITGLLQKVPDAVDFLEKHPDTYVTFVEVSNPEKIKNYCNKSVPLKDYLRLRLYDEKTGSELILFLDKQTHQLICKKYNKNHNLINQDPKEKCKELGGDFCSSKNECALPWLNSIEYCCPIPCGTCPETVNCDDKNNCTIDYCIVKKGEPVCIHKEITPCPNNGICELGEYEGPIDSYCPGEEYAVVSARIKSSDCPKTCDDGNPETGDWYNFTSQKCEHKLCEKKIIIHLPKKEFYKNEQIVINYTLYGFTHRGEYNINIYEYLYNPYNQQVWYDYNVGTDTEYSQHELSYYISFDPKDYLTGKYRLEIKIKDNIDGKESSNITEFEIKSKQGEFYKEDITPPVLNDLWVEAHQNIVIIYFNVTDDLSGIKTEGTVCDVHASIRNPSRTVNLGTCSIYNSTTGLYEEIIEMPEYSEHGTWIVDWVTLKDKTGNTRHYSYNDHHVSFEYFS